MSEQPVTIPKKPALRPALDFYQLRREGIGLIEQMGSRWWTDYNLHDPGITLLEALNYALVDLAYRTGWDIRDLLTAEAPSPDPLQPYPGQAFFTAREILTVNPWTPTDFRRLLIDLPGVRNAWMHCKMCSCDLHYFAWCEEDQLHFAYQRPANPNLAPLKTSVRGLWEAWLELETEPGLGDLNDRKLEQTFLIYDAEGQPHPLTIELRMPEWSLLQKADFEYFTKKNPQNQLAHSITKIGLIKFSRSKTDTNTIAEAELVRYWRDLFYVSFEVEFSGGKKIKIENASVRFFGDEETKKRVRVLPPVAAPYQYALADILCQIPPDNQSFTGFVQAYRQKLAKIGEQVEAAKKALHQHRNLSEDLCTVRPIAVEDVAVCADVEVAPDADIERVQAQIWFEAEQYFNPPIPFYSLAEMLAMGQPVEEIFNGPALENGFILNEDLENADLREQLRVSDLLNRLMDIEGVIAVNNLLLTKYDAEGQPVKGAADLHQPSPNPNQISAKWTMSVSPGHQPRLYLNFSRFLFYKNGLPFVPRTDEALDTLTQLRGEAERPKWPDGEKDLAIPKGTFRKPEQYYPVQYSLPATYGVGFEGLPGHVPLKRRAQARQLKAYLMVFEQLLVNALSQVANVAKLFSLDPATDRTYFTRLLSESLIKGAGEIFVGLDAAKLQALAETLPEFLERRNRFLDHLLARFGENFNEYTLLLTNLQGQTLTQQQLIQDKTAFLKIYPRISRDRARAFDVRGNLNDPNNVPGLRPRISRLLGFLAGSDHERFLIVEHLLLRPKFVGDALYLACVEGDCQTCGNNDPYSFRLTFVMAGWSAPFNKELDLRRFADRTIRQETPSHLLPKICWVGNRGYSGQACGDPLLGDLARWLEKDGATELTPEQACECAKAIFAVFDAAFKPWFDARKTDHQLRTAWEIQINALFSGIQPANIPCAAPLATATWQGISQQLLAYFTEIALNGWQFERFEAAWEQWLTANAAIDWTDEQLHERVEGILRANLLSPLSPTQGDDPLCGCATRILAAYGTQFFDWMKGKVASGILLKDVGNIPPVAGVTLCSGLTFRPGTANQIEALLADRYTAYREVSYRLWILLDLLAHLHNTYPTATLHDCDDGSDDNPVRLGTTALGGG